jgi:hypothetical protein
VDTFSTLAKQDVPKKHVAMTIHGMGFSLDETESPMAQIGGILDILQHQHVEIENDRAEQLQKSVAIIFEDIPTAECASDENWGHDLLLEEAPHAETYDATGRTDAGSVGGVKPYDWS